LYKKYLRCDSCDDKKELFSKILDQTALRFAGWLVYHTASCGTNGRKQLFFSTFVNNYFGLSRKGIQIQHNMGFGVSLKMFDDHKQHHSISSQQQVQGKELQPHVAWWDNFSKFHAHSIPTASKNVFSSCLWTGMTINEYVGPKVDDKVTYCPSFHVVPAMPDNICQERSVVDHKILACYNKGRRYYNNSMVKKFNIASVPLKIDVMANPKMKDMVDNPKNAGRLIHPHRLNSNNIGSNRGLTNILREYQEEHKMHLHGACTTYKCINSDENIFYRMLKVPPFFCL